MHNLVDNLLLKQSIDADNYTADANGTGVDTKGHHVLLAVISAGDVVGDDADETYTIKLQESSDDGSSDTYADITGASVSIPRDGDNEPYYIELTGLGVDHERYIRAVLDVGGTTPAIDVSVVFALGQADRAPVTQDN